MRLCGCCAELSPENLQRALAGLDLDKLPRMYGGRLPDDEAPLPKQPKRLMPGGSAGAGGAPEEVRPRSIGWSGAGPLKGIDGAGGLALGSAALGSAAGGGGGEGVRGLGPGAQ